MLYGTFLFTIMHRLLMYVCTEGLSRVNHNYHCLMLFMHGA